MSLLGLVEPSSKVKARNLRIRLTPGYYSDRVSTMPAIRGTGRSKKPPPEGFDDIEDTLLEFQNKMKDAEASSHEGKKRHEVMWPIFQITHQRTSLQPPQASRQRLT